MEVIKPGSRIQASPFGVLVPETAVNGPGEGPVTDISECRGGVLTLELDILRSIERESLRISIWGSADGLEWSAKPVLNFPRKYYCGRYQGILDLSGRPEIRYLRASWKAKRWGNATEAPVFTIALRIEETDTRPAAICA